MRRVTVARASGDDPRHADRARCRRLRAPLRHSAAPADAPNVAVGVDHNNNNNNNIFFFNGVVDERDCVNECDDERDRVDGSERRR